MGKLRVEKTKLHDKKNALRKPWRQKTFQQSKTMQGLHKKGFFKLCGKK